MKQTVLALCIVGILTVSILIVYAVFGKEQRNEELQAELAEAADTTINTLMEKRSYTADEAEEFVVDFMESFLSQVKSESDFKISVLSMDKEFGLLKLEVESRFHYPNGKEGKCSVVRDVLLEATKP